MSIWWRGIIEPGTGFGKPNIRKNRGIGMGRKKVELTKVTRPRLHSAYQRTELHTLMDELGATPLIMINSKPGSGKSTLVSTYIESRGIPCLWYQVDQNDQDLARFFYYLGIAALRVDPSSKVALPQVSPERVFRIPSLAKEYFQKLFQWFEAPFMMVFDNYQELPRDAVLHDVMAEACAALPPGGRIVLINNCDCRANVPKPRTGFPIATLGCEDLQLSPKEVKAIAALHGIKLPSDHAARQLQAKVGGWVAGLVHELEILRNKLLSPEEMPTTTI